MTNLYLDIETIPCSRPDLLADMRADAEEEKREALAAIRAPANYRDQAKISAFVEEARAKLIDEHEAGVSERIAKTSLDGGYGQICCIGYAKDEYTEDTIVGDERDMLTRFFAVVGNDRCCVIGHNIAAFDLPFLYKRAVILGIAMPAFWPLDPKPWRSAETFDTMTAWAGVKGRIGLRRLAKVVGLTVPADDVTGADVAGLWAKGDVSTIRAHCRDDVHLVRAVHRRMTFGRVG